MLPDIRPDDLQELVDAFGCRYSPVVRRRFMEVVVPSFVTTSLFLAALPSEIARIKGVGLQTLLLAGDVCVTVTQNADYYAARIIDDWSSERRAPERNPALKLRKKRRR